MFELSDLEIIVKQRAGAGAQHSYTASLIEKGINKCAEKFGEEAIEAIIAAATNNRDELTKETADVLFHLLVLLRAADISLSDVYSELQRRTSQSGHQEKASR
jgi:phosphoribosyl-ATP pyrophosphohydrolase